MWDWINKSLDRLESRLALFLIFFGNAAVTALGAYVAALTDWLTSWGPFGWLAAGLVVALMFSSGLLIVAKVMELRSRRAVNTKRAEKSTRINILKDSFEGEIIHVDDLWSFQHPILSGKRFHKCRFVGPMVIGFLNNVTANGLHIRDCNFIEIGNSYLNGVIGFEKCILTDCEYDCVTFLVHEDKAKELIRSSNGSVRFVNRPSGVQLEQPQASPTKGQD